LRLVLAFIFAKSHRFGDELLTRFIEERDLLREHLGISDFEPNSRALSVAVFCAIELSSVF
jgi:hypothetical protein